MPIAGRRRRRDEDWHDRSIFALGNSGDLRWYDWRFPLLWEEPVMQASARHQLDPAWILGVMRSESAMTEAARSSAGALGLMQVTPATEPILTTELVASPGRRVMSGWHFMVKKNMLS